MTAVRVGRFPLHSPEWYAAREGALGGSEIAAVLGLSRWESRFSLWHRKAGTIGPQPTNAEMDAGTRLEDAICQRFADDHPELKVRRAGTYRAKDRPWQIANPDRLVTGNGHGRAILETKLALYPDEWGTPGTDEIPPYYLTQCRWYLDVFDAQTCWVEVFIGSQGEFREYIVEADPDDQAYLREAGREFLDTLHAGTPPDIDEHDETYRAVKALHPDIDNESVEISAELAHQYNDALAAAHEAHRVKTLAASTVCHALGSARKATYHEQTIALRVAGRGDTPPFIRPGRGIPRKNLP